MGLQIPIARVALLVEEDKGAHGKRDADQPLAIGYRRSTDIPRCNSSSICQIIWAPVCGYKISFVLDPSSCSIGASVDHWSLAGVDTDQTGTVC